MIVSPLVELDFLHQFNRASTRIIACFALHSPRFPTFGAFSFPPLSCAFHLTLSHGILVYSFPLGFLFPPLPPTSHFPLSLGLLIPLLPQASYFPLLLAFLVSPFFLRFVNSFSPFVDSFSSGSLFIPLSQTACFRHSLSFDARHAALPVKTGCQRKVCSRSWFLQ